MKQFVAFIALLLVPALARAEEKKPPTMAQVLNRALGAAERDFVSLVEAFPEEKLDFAPQGDGFKGVRSFRQQAVHVTGSLKFFAAALLGDALQSEAEQDAQPAHIKSKADLVAWIKETFAYAHKAIDGVNERNFAERVGNAEFKATRLAMASESAWHTFDHYGQMVVYARMNGVVPGGPPPANTKGKQK